MILMPNIVVLVKRVPDTNARIVVSGDRVDLSAVKWVISPYDEFAIETAMRLNEQLTVRWEQVDLKKMLITVLPEYSKTGVERQIPLTPRAIQILKSLPRSISGRVFPVSLNNFQRAWRSITRNAEIKDLHWHDLRREAVSRLFEKGLSVSEVQTFVGNSFATLSVYTEHNSTTLAEKLAK